MPEPFTLQLHITDRCQLQCRHCYRYGGRAELPLATMLDFVRQLADFCRAHDLPGRLALAGGEPLLRYEDLLAITREGQKHDISMHLLTNGIALTSARIAKLRDAGCQRVQISIDGDRAAHDSLRGPGAYDKALTSLRLLRDAGIWSTISMTIAQWNMDSLPSVMALATEMHAKLFVARHVPCGVGAQLREQMLTAEEWARVMDRCRALSTSHKSGVAMRDPLFIPGHDCTGCFDGGVGGCACGYNGLAVESDGTAYACRRLDVPLGKLHESSLDDIWRHPILEQLRRRENLHGQCGACRWNQKCGGCRAIALAASGDMLGEDPQCSQFQPPPLAARLRRRLSRLHRHA